MKKGAFDRFIIRGVLTDKDHVICSDCYEKDKKYDFTGNEEFILEHISLGLVAMRKLKKNINCKTCGVHMISDKWVKRRGGV